MIKIILLPMEEEKVILFYDSCRLCLKNQAFVNMFQATDLVDDIFLCTGVKVSDIDNLPQKICMSCLEIVTNSKRLRILATMNDKTMRSLFNEEEGSTDRGYSQSLLGSLLPSNNQENVTYKSLDDYSTKSDEYVLNKSGNIHEETRKSNSRIENYTNAIAVIHDQCVIKEESKMISVTKDLFDSTSAVSSATNEISLEEKVSKKKLKLEDKANVEFKCEICNKTYNTWKKFYCHQRAHNKSIACPLDACGKLFATKGDLEKHIRTHTGERPYECNLCDKSFVQRVTLKAHRKSVHAE